MKLYQAWEQRKFVSVFEGLQNNTLSRADLNYENGTVKNVHYGDVLIKFGDYIDASRTDLPYISDDAKAEKFKNSFLQDGDIIIADTAEDDTVGKCTEIQGSEGLKLLSGLHTVACRPKEKYGPMFLGYYINSPAYHNQLKPLMQGIKVTSISKSALQDTDMIMPKSIEEQTMIGGYFANLDSLITLHQRKSLHNITQKNPWEQRKLLEFGLATGGTSIESEFSEDGIYKVISIGSYSEDSVYRDQGIRAVRSDKTVNRILNKGDITMILNDKTASGNIIGRVLLIEESGVYVYNQRTERIEVDNSNYDSQFIYTMLNAPEIRDKIIKQSQGNTQIYVNWTTISQTDYLVPQLSEQRKIGEYFRSLDHLITLHRRAYYYKKRRTYK